MTPAHAWRVYQFEMYMRRVRAGEPVLHIVAYWNYRIMVAR